MFIQITFFVNLTEMKINLLFARIGEMSANVKKKTTKMSEKVKLLERQQNLPKIISNHFYGAHLTKI